MGAEFDLIGGWDLWRLTVQENTVPNSHDALRGSAATKKNNRDQHTFPMPYDIFAMFDKGI